MLNSHNKELVGVYLNFATEQHVFRTLVGFHRGILRYDSGAGARSVEQNTIKVFRHLDEESLLFRGETLGLRVN